MTTPLMPPRLLPPSRPDLPDLPTPPSGWPVGCYATYEEAQRAVDYLADQSFPVEDVTIVGVDLMLVERVLGRLTWGAYCSPARCRAPGSACWWVCCSACSRCLTRGHPSWWACSAGWHRTSYRPATSWLAEVKSRRPCVAP